MELVELNELKKLTQLVLDTGEVVWFMGIDPQTNLIRLRSVCEPGEYPMYTYAHAWQLRQLRPI
jgi:hypothetical protein